MQPELLDLPAPAEPPQERWTADRVGDCLVEAFRTLDRLPRAKGPRQPGNHWVRTRVEWADKLAQAELPEAERREREGAHLAAIALRPSGRDIDRMETALDWLRDLRAVDPGLALVTTLWALRTARRRSLRALCREKGWAPGTSYKLRARALEHLATTLQAAGVPVF